MREPGVTGGELGNPETQARQADADPRLLWEGGSARARRRGGGWGSPLSHLHPGVAQFPEHTLQGSSSPDGADDCLHCRHDIVHRELTLVALLFRHLL